MEMSEDITNLITQLLSIRDQSTVENLVKKTDFLAGLIKYINNVLASCYIHYDSSLNESEEQDVKSMFINELIIILTNLIMIMKQFFEKKPNTFILIDLDNQWYSLETTIIPNENKQQLTDLFGSNKSIGSNKSFSSNKSISIILTIVCKIIDFLNEYYQNQIKNSEKK